MSKYLNEKATAPEETSRNKEEAGDTIQTSGAFDPIRRINDGFKQFKIKEFNKYPEYYRQLAQRQEPKFLIFACSDSRVSPTNILNLRPGEAFMARNIANLVPVANTLRYSDIGAIIEYAVVVLKVQVILVIGHSRCGGIERLLQLPDDQTSYDFLDDWVSVAEPAKAKVIAENPDATSEELRTLLEKESVLYSLQNLLSYPYVQSGTSLQNLLSYPYVQSGIAANTLKLLGGYYDFVRGKFEILETVDTTNTKA